MFLSRNILRVLTYDLMVIALPGTPVRMCNVFLALVFGMLSTFGLHRPTCNTLSRLYRVLQNWKRSIHARPTSIVVDVPRIVTVQQRCGARHAHPKIERRCTCVWSYSVSETNRCYTYIIMTYRRAIIAIVKKSRIFLIPRSSRCEIIRKNADRERGKRNITVLLVWSRVLPTSYRLDLWAATTDAGMRFEKCARHGNSAHRETLTGRNYIVFLCSSS